MGDPKDPETPRRESTVIDGVVKVKTRITALPKAVSSLPAPADDGGDVFSDAPSFAPAPAPVPGIKPAAVPTNPRMERPELSNPKATLPTVAPSSSFSSFAPSSAPSPASSTNPRMERPELSNPRATLPAPSSSSSSSSSSASSAASSTNPRLERPADDAFVPRPTVARGGLQVMKASALPDPTASNPRMERPELSNPRATLPTPSSSSSSSSSSASSTNPRMERPSLASLDPVLPPSSSLSSASLSSASPASSAAAGAPVPMSLEALLRPEPSSPSTPRPAVGALDPPLPRPSFGESSSPSRPRPRPMESLDPVLPPASASSTAPAKQHLSAADLPLAGVKVDVPPAAPVVPVTVKAKTWLKAGIASGALVAVVGAVAVVVLALSDGTDAPVARVSLYKPAEQAAMSQRWKETVRNELVSEPALLAAVTAVARTLVREGPPPEVLVLTRNEHVALALPDGTLVVSVGFLRALHSEAELAAVLAHAQAHVSNGDTDAALTAHPELAAGVRVSLGGGTADGAAAAIRAAVDADHGEAAEAAADAVAVKVLKTAAWDGAALRAALAVARPPFATHHPVTETRLAALKVEEARRLPGSNLLQNDGGRTNAAEYARVLALLPQR